MFDVISACHSKFLDPTRAWASSYLARFVPLSCLDARYLGDSQKQEKYVAPTNEIRKMGCTLWSSAQLHVISPRFVAARWFAWGQYNELGSEGTDSLSKAPLPESRVDTWLSSDPAAMERDLVGALEEDSPSPCSESH